jgi:hypothetical protein
MIPKLLGLLAIFFENIYELSGLDSVYSLYKYPQRISLWIQESPWTHVCSDLFCEWTTLMCRDIMILALGFIKYFQRQREL